MLIRSVILLFLTPVFLSAQESIRFRVDSERINGEESALDHETRGQFMQIYFCGDSSLCFANIWHHMDMQSYGRMYHIQIEELPLEEAPFQTELQWIWTYRNTYDLKENLAIIILKVETLEPGSRFILTMYLPDKKLEAVLVGTIESSVFPPSGKGNSFDDWLQEIK